jgi:hypothetical protein
VEQSAVDLMLSNTTLQMPNLALLYRDETDYGVGIVSEHNIYRVTNGVMYLFWRGTELEKEIRDSYRYKGWRANV